MKTTIQLILFLTISIIFCACSSDELPENFMELRYDGENLTSPALLAGLFESAIMFPAAFAGNNEGNKIVSIDYFIEEIPQTASLHIYFGGNLQPDSLIYTAAILNEIQSNKFNTHTLSAPITLSGNENIWVGIRYSQAAFETIIGCDNGPTKTNGDWIYDATDGLFLPLSERSTTNINWNIRVLVDSE